MTEYQIIPEWEKYYTYLEKLRKSGATNMYGAAPWLEARFGIEKELAYDILANWMKNYDELSAKYGWRID